MGDNETKYPTWKWWLMLALTIIGFLLLRGINSIEARIDGIEKREAVIQRENAATCTRVTVLEENFKALRDDNDEIKQGLKAVVAALNVHERNTIAAIRKSRGE